MALSLTPSSMPRNAKGIGCPEATVSDVINSFEGSDEKHAHKEFVHLAITYRSDGTVTGYRNGETYGKPYKRAKPLPEGQRRPHFRRCHLPAVSNRMLSARIRETRLYDRARTRRSHGFLWRDLRSCFRKGSDRFSFTRATQGKECTEKRRNELAKELNNYKSKGRVQGRGPNDIALALFNMKEFIYLK